MPSEALGSNVTLMNCLVSITSESSAEAIDLTLVPVCDSLAWLSKQPGLSGFRGLSQRSALSPALHLALRCCLQDLVLYCNDTFSVVFPYAYKVPVVLYRFLGAGPLNSILCLQEVRVDYIRDMSIIPITASLISENSQCIWSAPNVDIYEIEVNLQIYQGIPTLTDEVVAVIISFLGPHADLDLIVSGFAGGLEEVLWKELSLLVKVVAGTLRNVFTRLDMCF